MGIERGGRSMTTNKVNVASKCYEIQVSLGNKMVPEFEAIPEIGMLVRLALHLRGLPIIKYDTLKLVALHYLKIPALILKNLVYILGEIEFVKIDSEGDTIKAVLPTVPYFEDVYSGIEEYAELKKHFNEPEKVAIAMLSKLVESPVSKSSLYELGTDNKVVNRNLQIGDEGGYIISRRARGKDIVLSPTFFSENGDVYADLVAKSGAKQVQKLLKLIKSSQGWPLSLIKSTKEINGIKLTDDEIELLKRLGQDGAVKPPSIVTSHSGINYFMFTPTPGNAKLNASKREVYERAMALVASVRQGQLLPKEYAIKWPTRLLSALKRNGYVSANTEAFEQYKKLTVLRVGYLKDMGSGWYRFCLSEAEENYEAVDLAISMVSNGNFKGMEIDEEARMALQKDQEYIESIIAIHKLRESESVSLSEEQVEELDNIILGGVSNN